MATDGQCAAAVLNDTSPVEPNTVLACMALSACIEAAAADFSLDES